MAKITGTEENDHLEGTEFADRIIGLGGADYVWGGDGIDVVKAGGGNDNVYGGQNNDALYGGAGGDDISGDQGQDQLFGGLGDDELYGGEGFDQVFGGSGDDRIFDSEGGDSLDGGRGRDTLSLNYGTFFGGGPGPLDFTFDSSGAEFVTPDGSTAVGFERLSIMGSDYNDTLTGGAREDHVRGWQGDDLLHGGRGDDFLIGDNGNDTEYGDEGHDLVTGNGGSDTLYGGAGDDTLVGGGVADVVSGNDFMEGGAGADFFRAGVYQTDISFEGSEAGVYVDMVEGWGFGGDAQGDIYSGGEAKIRGKVIGSAFDDLIIGGHHQLGGGGDDRLVTSLSTQTMGGGDGADVFALRYDGGSQYHQPLLGDFDQAEDDVLDVSAIDAGRKGGDQAFRFLGAGPFDDRPGGLRYEVVGGQTIVQMSTDRDADVELAFVLDGVYVLTAADFVL